MKLHGLQSWILAIAVLGALACDGDRWRYPVVPPVSTDGETDPAPAISTPTDDVDDSSVDDRDDEIRGPLGNRPPNVRNVRVITHDGVLTLEGQVHSERDRRKIGSLARNLSADRIDNQLVVARNASPSTETDRR